MKNIKQKVIIKNGKLLGLSKFDGIRALHISKAVKYLITV